MTRHPQNPQAIAGVIPVILDDLPLFSDVAKGDYATFLERRYDETQRVAELSLRDPEFQYSVLPMTSELLLQGSGDGHFLTYSFLLTQELLQNIRSARITKGSELTQSELLAVGLAEGSEAVTPDFSAGAMNAINASLYASRIGLDTAAGVAHMYAESRPLNCALGRLIADNVQSAEQLRIKELACSGMVQHWEDIVRGISPDGAIHIALTLTDFVDAMSVPRMEPRNLKAWYERYSLFDDLPILSPAERFDAIVVTYGFDSVWQPEDERLTRVGGQWYKTVYRVKAADWAPRREELLFALRAGRPLANATLRDYDGIAVETAMQPIDIAAHPFARYITKSSKDIIDVPGGLIKRVVNAFDTQLNETGVFISGDVAHLSALDSETQSDLADTDRRLSGVAARFKIEDYALAKQIIESEYDFKVVLMSLNDLIGTYLTDDNKTHWKGSGSDRIDMLMDLLDNGVMVIRRKT